MKITHARDSNRLFVICSSEPVAGKKRMLCAVSQPKPNVLARIFRWNTYQLKILKRKPQLVFALVFEPNNAIAIHNNLLVWSLRLCLTCSVHSPLPLFRAPHRIYRTKLALRFFPCPPVETLLSLASTTFLHIIIPSFIIAFNLVVVVCDAMN